MTDWQLMDVGTLCPELQKRWYTNQVKELALGTPSYSEQWSTKWVTTSVPCLSSGHPLWLHMQSTHRGNNHATIPKSGLDMFWILAPVFRISLSFQKGDFGPSWIRASRRERYRKAVPSLW